MSEHTPLTEAERDLADLLHPWLDNSNHCPYSPQSMCPNTARSRNLARLVAARTSTATADTFAVVDLDDPYFDGQTLPEALAPYPDHVHSTKGVCVKAPGGRFCGTPEAHRAATADTGLRERVEAAVAEGLYERIVGAYRTETAEIITDALTTAAPPQDKS